HQSETVGERAGGESREVRATVQSVAVPSNIRRIGVEDRTATSETARSATGIGARVFSAELLRSVGAEGSANFSTPSCYSGTFLRSSDGPKSSLCFCFRLFILLRVFVCMCR